MNTRASLLLALVISLAAGPSAAQQAACPPGWLPTFGTGATDGFDATVRAFAVFDDASGGGPALYAAGLFTSAGGAPANYVARWDGTNWSPVGSGMDDRVIALLVFDDGSGAGPALYAGGHFTSAGGAAASYVAKWDGTSWSPVGSGMNDWINVLTVFDDGSGAGLALYAGGNFTQAGGTSASHVAKWDGSNWSRVGSGMNTRVYAFADFDDGSGGGPALYAGGLFTSAGGAPANYVAKWDGTSWSALGTGMNSRTYYLEVFDDGGGPALHAAGNFTTAGGVSANRIARWDGSSWAALSSGMDDTVFDLRVFDDGAGAGPALYAGGKFTLAGGVPASRIARWNGTSWAALGSGMNDTVSAFTVFDDGGGGGPVLCAGGAFTVAGGSPANRIAQWGCPSPAPFTVFCTAKQALFCGPASISASGSPSATATSGFTIEARPVRGCRAGLLLYSNQPVQPGVAFGGPGDGVLCLSGMGLKRAGPIQTGSLPNLCEATFAIDLNRFHANVWMATGCTPPAGQNNPAGFLGNMGTTVNAQMWGRDSIATGQVLSDGIGWVVGP